MEGRELYVGVLGNDRIRTLTPWEFIFGELKAGRAAIATRKAKWDRAYQKRHGITSGKAEGLPAGLAEKLDRLARRIYRALHLTGYARIDFRVRADGTPLVLEANANPNLEREEDFADAALNDGIGVPGAHEAPSSHWDARTAPHGASRGLVPFSCSKKADCPLLLEVLVEPADHGVVPLHGIGRLQHPVVFVREVPAACCRCRGVAAR